jgi:hypothetical protein
MSTSNAKTYLLTLLRRRRACHLNFRRYEVETKILDLVSLRFLLWGCGAQKEVSFTLDSLLVCEIQRNSLLLDPKNLLLLSPPCLTEPLPLPHRTTPPTLHTRIDNHRLLSETMFIKLWFMFATRLFQLVLQSLKDKCFTNMIPSSTNIVAQNRCRHIYIYIYMMCPDSLCKVARLSCFLLRAR